jgi:RecA/RadA recombinase
MRPSRVLAVLGLAAALSLPAAAAAAQQGRQHVGLHDMTCTSIAAQGEGLAKNATFDLTLVNQDDGSTLATRSVRSSEMGDFMVRLPARLNQVLSLRLVVARPDGTKVAFADHVMAKGAAMCNLPFTGPSRAATLLLVGAGAVGFGLLLVVVAARPPMRLRRR